MTPSRLKKCFPESSGLCWRCEEEEGTLIHVFWTCPKIQPFWGEVRRITQKFTEYIVPEDPAFFLLHLSSVPIKTYKKSLVRHLLNAAKGCIPIFWKQTLPPPIKLWLHRVEEIRRMEDLVLTEQHKQETFKQTWDNWNMFIFSDEGQRLLS